MKDTAAVVIPIHKSSLSPLEEARVSATVRNAGTCPIYFVGPEGLDTRYYTSGASWGDVNISLFDPKNFSSIRAYSNWLLTPEIYDFFKDFEFILLAQTDAFLINPIDYGKVTFDYIGAPWNPPFEVGWDPIRRRPSLSRWSLGRKRISVGNGGLSIRRNSKMSDFVRRLPRLRSFRNEDVVISFFAADFGLSLPTPEIAGRFFSEGTEFAGPAPQTPLSIYGFHGLEKVDKPLEEHLLKFD